MTDLQQISADERIVRSTCRGCHGGCGVLVHLTGDEVTLVEGDAEHPVNHGTLCALGMAARETLYHPHRLQYPMRRVGPRGSGEWQRISWDEAYDEVVSKLGDLRDRHGAESVAVIQGTGRDYAEFLYRFANVFGTPNVTTPGYLCYFSRVVTHLTVCGAVPIADYVRKPRCIVIWGCNPHITSPEEYKGVQLLDALGGAKLIVVDPRFTTLAARADMWLQPRPGTDAALMLGWLNVIIEENLYDREFVEDFTTGFDRLVERVKEYPVERVAELTWVPPEQIRAAARLYATTKPASFNPSQVLDGNVNCVSNALADIHLMALTGNLDQPGGNALYLPPPVTKLSSFALHEHLSAEQRKKRIGGKEFPVADWGAMSPSSLLCKAVLEGDPYPIRAFLIFGSNPLLSWPNAQLTRKVLDQVEFSVVTDLFMTPTAALAAVVLPAAHWLETDDVSNYWVRSGIVSPRVKVTQVAEAKSDQEIINELGRRIGPASAFFETMEDAMNDLLRPSGMTWTDFRELRVLTGQPKFEKYQFTGFSTPSRKYEFVPSRLEATGKDPLPRYVEPPESPVSDPEGAKEYPLILMTGLRQPVFFHSEGRQIGILREKWPNPLLEIHPDTAAELGIQEGDWAIVESRRGSARFKARLTPGVHRRVVGAPHGWWYPEEGGPEFGWKTSNVNMLTSSDPPYDPIAGAVNIRTLNCRVCKAEEV